MEDQQVNTQESHRAFVERLEALNTILSGLRTVMVSGEDKAAELQSQLEHLKSIVDTLKSESGSWTDLSARLELLEKAASSEEASSTASSEAALEGRIDEVNALMASIKTVVSEELNDLSTRLRQVEAQDTVSREQLEAFKESLLRELSSEEKKDDLSVDVLQQLEALSTLVEACQTQVQKVVRPEEIFPQLDELRYHQESMEAQLHGLNQEELSADFADLKERQSDHQLRLQQLESAKEQGLMALEKVQSELEQVQASASRQSAGIESQAQELRAQLDKGLAQFKSELETSFDGMRQSLAEESGERVETFTSLESQLKALSSELENVSSELLGQTLERVQGLESRWAAEEAELKAGVEESVAEIRMVLDNLSRRDVRARAKESELERGLEGLGEKLATEMNSREVLEQQWLEKVEALGGAWSKESEELRAQLDEKDEELQQLKLGQSKLGQEFKVETEKRAEGMTRELVLARDHMEDQQRRVDEDLETLKKSHRELGAVKEQLAKEEQATQKAKRDLGDLKGELNHLRDELSSQRRFALGGVAAAFLLSVGVSSLMLPNAMDLQVEAAPAYSQTAPVAREELIALDAPVIDVAEVDPSAEFDESTVTEVVPDEVYADVESSMEPEVDAESVETMVTTAFSREDTQEASSFVESEPETPKAQSYVVKEGDSLWRIAKKHPGEGSVIERIEKIKRDNQLENDSIRPGRVLSIYL